MRLIISFFYYCFFSLYAFKKEILISLTLQTHLFGASILLHPAGDAKNTGRVIEQTYERALSYHIATGVEKILKYEYGLQVSLTRKPGEEINALQVASFSNRLNPSFFLSINVHQQQEPKPSLYFFHLLFNPLVDYVQPYYNPLAPIPLYKAHTLYKNQTVHKGTFLCSYLTTQYSHICECKGMFGIPLRSLLGVTSPALAIDIGISQSNQWEQIVRPLALSIYFALKE